MADSLCRERVKVGASFIYTAVRVSKKLVHLRVKDGIAELKRRHQVGKATLKPIDRLLPPSKPINLDLAYPEPGKESARHPHQAFLDECRQARIEKALQESAAV